MSEGERSVSGDEQYQASEPDTYGTRGMAVLYRHGGYNGDPAEWPEDLRVREFPKAGGAS